MDDTQRAAYVFAMSVCTLAAIEGMKAENMQREACGNSMAFGYDEFIKVIEEYGIHHNGVMTTFHGP